MSSVRAVLYAAKSTEDTKGSIDTQLEDCRLLAASKGLAVDSEFQDESKSAFKGNRGPGLEQALARCEQIVAEDGKAALVVQHSDRLARGDGRQAKHLVEYLLWALQGNVTMESVQDPFSDGEFSLALAAMMGTRNSEDSRRKSLAVRDGKKRQLARGEPLGGPIPDGYSVRRLDDDGKVVRTFHLDPDRAPVVRTMFDLAEKGTADAEIARRLNGMGHRTKAGRPFHRRSVQSTLTNPFYAGRIAYKRGTKDEEVVDGRHPALIDPATFDRIQAARELRDLGRNAHGPTGRPAKLHALQGLAVCGRCGEGLYAVTSSYKRRDGTKARQYVCHSYKDATGTCDAKPIKAEVVDAAVIAGMDTLLVDFETWQQEIADGHQAERNRLTAEVDRARADLDAQAHKTGKTEAKWSEYLVTDEKKADLVLPMVDRERDALARAERRLQAAQDALNSVPTDIPADAMLDFANSLRAAVKGRLESANTVRSVNVALRELFDCFVLTEDDTSGLFGGITIGPFLKKGTIMPPTDNEFGWDWPKNVRPDDDPPPLRWLETDPSPEPSTDLSVTGRNSQHLPPFRAGWLRLPELVVPYEDRGRRQVPHWPREQRSAVSWDAREEVGR